MAHASAYLLIDASAKVHVKRLKSEGPRQISAICSKWKSLEEKQFRYVHVL